jgi:hypothetical protein
MTHATQNNSHAAPPDPHELNELRFLARSVGILAILTGLIYLRVISAESAAALGNGQWAPVSVFLFALIALATLGLLCAWHWELAGSILSLLCAPAIALLAYESHPEQPWFAAFAYGTPFLITGGLFLTCHYRSR